MSVEAKEYKFSTKNLIAILFFLALSAVTGYVVYNKQMKSKDAVIAETIVKTDSTKNILLDKINQKRDVSQVHVHVNPIDSVESIENENTGKEKVIINVRSNSTQEKIQEKPKVVYVNREIEVKVPVEKETRNFSIKSQNTNTAETNSSATINTSEKLFIKVSVLSEQTLSEGSTLRVTCLEGPHKGEIISLIVSLKNNRYYAKNDIYSLYDIAKLEGISKVGIVAMKLASSRELYIL